MFERLIENWLINVHELGYQIPFCQVLLNQGYRLLHVSRHGPGEHGKDIVARSPQGKLETFQLKGGDIFLQTWREIRGEVEDLVYLPAQVPGVRKGEPYTPYLVTNGELRGDALTSIQQYAQEWVDKGYPKLEIIQRHDLLKRFIDAHGKFLPTALTDIRQFIELYVTDFRDRIPREKFASFLLDLIKPELVAGRGVKSKRAIESLVLMGSYIVEQYERAQNHVSAAEGWTIIASSILHLAAREGLQPRAFVPSLELARTALMRNLDNLEKEALQCDFFLAPDLITETDAFISARVVTTLGWLAATALIRQSDEGYIRNAQKLREIVYRERLYLKTVGEADWPYFFSLCLCLEKIGESPLAEFFLLKWAEGIAEINTRETGPAFPSPYWLQDKALADLYDLLPAYEKENFVGHSYTIFSALDCLVRRLRRQAIASLWPKASSLVFCDYIPETPEEWFLWQSHKGELQMICPQQPTSWTEWIKSAAKCRRDSFPQLLLDHTEWLLPFSLTYPHRVNRNMSALLDCLIGESAELVERTPSPKKPAKAQRSRRVPKPQRGVRR